MEGGCPEKARFINRTGTSLGSPPYPPSTAPGFPTWPASTRPRWTPRTGKRNCFEAVTERPGRKPLIARFGGIPLHRQKKAVIDDRPAVPAPARKELVTRLRAGRCEWCQRHAAVETHQVRKLADLTRPGRPQPAWAQRMARMRRKTLIVCVPCHQAIHAGTLTAVTA